MLSNSLSERLDFPIVPLPAICVVFLHYDYKGRKKIEIIHCFYEKLFQIFVAMYTITQNTNPMVIGWWWHSTNRWCEWR